MGGFRFDVTYRGVRFGDGSDVGTDPRARITARWDALSVASFTAPTGRGSWFCMLRPAAWRYENESGEPVFLKNTTDRWSRDADGVMVHADKSPNTMYGILGIGSLSLLLRS